MPGFESNAAANAEFVFAVPASERDGVPASVKNAKTSANIFRPE
jgi:hypothetical protein